MCKCQVVKFGGTFWFPAMEAMEMESEKSLQRKQATYTSLVTTLLLFLIYSTFNPFYRSTSSLAFRLVAEKPWKKNTKRKSKSYPGQLPMVLKSPAPVAILMVSQYPDGSVDFLIFEDRFDKLLLLFCDFEFGIVDCRTSSLRFRRRRTGASSTARFTLLVSTWCEPFSIPSFPIWNPIYPVTFASKSPGNL